MAYGSEIIEYKNKIASALLGNDEIVKTVFEVIPPEKAADFESPDDLLYQYIFPFDYIPETIQEVGCYICYEIEVPKVSRVNYFFKDIVLNFNIICNQKTMRTSYGATRTDYLSHLIELLFNGREYGYEKLELVSSVPGHVSQVHRSRTLRFTTLETNRLPDACDNDEEIFDG